MRTKFHMYYKKVVLMSYDLLQVISLFHIIENVSQTTSTLAKSNLRKLPKYNHSIMLDLRNVFVGKALLLHYGVYLLLNER